MRFAAVTASIWLLTGVVHAQSTVSVHLPPGDLVAFAAPSPLPSLPVDPVVPKDGVVQITTKQDSDRLYVWDRSHNRISSTTANKTDWSPKLDELKNLAQVIVQVRHDGKPVAAANLTLEDGRKHTLLLDPSTKGDATFCDVKPTKLTVSVDYRAAGNPAAPVTQIFDATAAKDDVPRYTVALPEAAATVGGDEPSAPDSASEPRAEVESASGVGGKPVNRGSGFGQILVSLFALVVAGGLAAAGYFFLRKNPEKFGETLEKLGAQIPKPGDAPLSDPPIAAAPAPAAPAPPQKIVLDPAPAPIDIATATEAPAAGSQYLMPAASPAPTGQPALLSSDGVTIPLNDGETIVGREIGLGLSLAGESTVSRKHAVLTRAGTSVTLTDAGSTNGTFVNGQPVSGAVTLKSGDAVQFGAVKFRYQD